MIVCIGATNVDIKSCASEKFISGSSNPVRSSISAGGVARNITENLARLDAAVKLISRVGDDAHGQWLLASLRAKNIDTNYISISSLSRTATYTALLEPDGEMLIATADMEICDEITPDLLASHHDILSKAFVVVVDGNLPSQTLEYVGLITPKHVFLWAVAVSVSKIERLRAVLPTLSGIILNYDEFLSLTKNDDSLDLLPSLQKGSRQLLNHSLQTVIVTCGKFGVCLAETDRLLFFRIEELENMVDVTGAGDAFSAGVIAGLFEQLPLDHAVVYGLAAARMTLMTRDSVHPFMTKQSLLKELQKNFYTVDPHYSFIPETSLHIKSHRNGLFAGRRKDRPFSEEL